MKTFTVPNLKSCLKYFCCSCYGKKDELYARLVTQIQKDQGPAFVVAISDSEQEGDDDEDIEWEEEVEESADVDVDI